MKISEIKTLKEVSEEYNIPKITLFKRLEIPFLNLIEGEDYRRLERPQSIIFSPEGVKKIIRYR